MANDHAGTALKKEIKQWLEADGHEVLDFGTHDEASVDLSDYVYPAALAVAKGEAERAILVDGVGYGSALIANKLPDISAVVCQDPFCAGLARQHTDSNVLCLGGKTIGSAIAMAIVQTWMTTPFNSAEPKYARRNAKVAQIAARHVRPLSEIAMDETPGSTPQA